MSDSLRPHGPWPAGLLCPWDFSRQEGRSGGAVSFSTLTARLPTLSAPRPAGARRGLCPPGLTELGRGRRSARLFDVPLAASSYRSAAAEKSLSLSRPPPRAPLPRPLPRERVSRPLRSRGVEALPGTPLGPAERLQRGRNETGRACSPFPEGHRTLCRRSGRASRQSAPARGPHRGPARAQRGAGRVPRCLSLQALRTLPKPPMRPQKPPHPSARYFLPGPSLR